ncbi:hypothetical protein [Flavobacterium sp.]|uniref:hypothetical protein n=1 Tax=Flavobacterium sp. TaxID=239 RepID=UPI002C5CAFD6|nr:hypothetical protein [Flavobacterium sp.]HSD05756.1 hypothetical protein [Flavobacterium sp.]
MDFFKNASPMFFYFISIAAFVLANVIRENNISVYYALLIVGLVFFFLGLMRRIKQRR